MSELNLKSEEIDFLSKYGRCASCGHLEALHNEHCCVFCMVPGCKCAWGKVEESDKAE